MIKRALVMLALAVPLGAQGFVAGVRGGPNVSWNQSGNSSALLGAMTGVFVTYDLGPVISIQAEVNYSEKGWGTLGADRTRIKYLEVPIVARITPTERWPLQPYGLVGVAHAREISCDKHELVMIGSMDPNAQYSFPPGADGVFPTHTETRDCNYSYPNRTRHDVGFALGLGVLRHSKRFEYSFEYRRTRGQRDLLNPGASRYFREPTNDVGAMVFSAAYRIR